MLSLAAFSIRSQLAIGTPCLHLVHACSGKTAGTPATASHLPPPPTGGLARGGKAGGVHSRYVVPGASAARSPGGGGSAFTVPKPAGLSRQGPGEVL